MKYSLKPSLLSAGSLALTLLASSSAMAHIDLMEPEARAHGTGGGADTNVDPGSNQKLGPCGQDTNARTTRVATYAPGETINLRIVEEINHASYIRVWLQPDGDANIPTRPVALVASTETAAQALTAEEALDMPGDADGRLLAVLVDDNSASGMELTYEVTLPTDVTCTNCTLQVIQFMYDAGNPFYYQCADLVIADGGAMGDVSDSMAGNAGVGGMGMMAAGGAGGMAGGSMMAAGGAGGLDSGNVDVSGDITPADDDDGCSISEAGTGNASSTGVAALLMLGLGAMLRRRRSW